MEQLGAVVVLTAVGAEVSASAAAAETEQTADRGERETQQAIPWSHTSDWETSSAALSEAVREGWRGRRAPSC